MDDNITTVLRLLFTRVVEAGDSAANIPHDDLEALENELGKTFTLINESKDSSVRHRELYNIIVDQLGTSRHCRRCYFVLLELFAGILKRSQVSSRTVPRRRSR
jgi:hypothetical protein